MSDAKICIVACKIPDIGKTIGKKIVLLWLY